MRPTQVRVVIRQKLNVGGFENIEPEVEICADLDSGDDPAVCLASLHKMAQSAWAKQALTELGWVAQRRASDKDKTKVHEYRTLTTSTKDQLKGLIL